MLELLTVEPGAHLGVSGSRMAATQDALNAMRFLVDQFQAMGATYLHQGCCKGWDEASVPIAQKAGLVVVAHPPLIETHLSMAAWKNSDYEFPRKSYRNRNMDIAFESCVLVIGPQYPEDDPRSERSGTWMTARFARLYGSRVYACWTDGNIEDVTERRVNDSTGSQ